MSIVKFLRSTSVEGCDYIAGQKIDFGDGDKYRAKIAEWQQNGPVVEVLPLDVMGIVTTHNPRPPYGEVYVEPPAELPVEISSTEPTDS